MSTNGLVIGNRRRLTATFYNDQNQLLTPTTVTLKIRKPDGTVATVVHASLQNPSTGLFYYDVDLNQGGIWTYRFEGSGNTMQAREETFVVESSGIS